MISTVGAESDLDANSASSACLDDVAAIAFVESTATLKRRAEIVLHLEICAECRKLVAGVVAMTKYSDTLLASAGPASRARPESFGAFRLGALIAQGGMGSIYRAYDTVLGRDVALKVPRSRMDAIARRFEREAAITARLEHPGIVPIHGAGQTPEGTPFYVMRFIEGRTLDALVDEAETTAARLVLVDRVLDVARTMAYVHGKRIVHRDLKPNNILVDTFGAPLIIDWGLAKQLSDGRASLPVIGLDRNELDTPVTAAALRTTAGEVMGTPAFMSPEQAAGEPVDERADVHALGAILRYVLTGTLPRDADAAIEGPRQIAEVCRRAMAFEPAERYRDAGEFAAALETALAAVRPKPDVVPRSRMHLWLAAGSIVAILAILTVVWLARRDSVETRPRLRTISRMPAGLLFLALSPSGERIAFNARERIQVLDLRTGENWTHNAWTVWPWAVSFDTEDVLRFVALAGRDSAAAQRLTWNFRTDEIVVVSPPSRLDVMGYWIGRLGDGDLFFRDEISRNITWRSPHGETELPSASLRPLRLFAIDPRHERVAFVEHGPTGEVVRVSDSSGRGFVSAPILDIVALSWLDDRTLIYSVGSSNGSTLYTAHATADGLTKPTRLYQSDSGGWLGSVAGRSNRVVATWFTSSYETRLLTRDGSDRPLDKSAITAALGWLDDTTFLAYSSATGQIERVSTLTTVLPKPTAVRLAGDPANATRAGDLLIVAMRSGAGRRSVVAQDLRETTPRWTAAPGQLMFVRCAGDRQAPCIAAKQGAGGMVKVVRIDPQTGTLGDTVIAEGGIADAAIDDAGTEVVWIVENRDIMRRPLDLSAPAHPVPQSRGGNHTLAFDPLGGVFASASGHEGRELIRYHDGRVDPLLNAGSVLMSLIRASPGGAYILFRARTLSGDVVEVK